MARSKQTFLKREKEKNRQQKQKQKEVRRVERKNNSNKGKGLEELILSNDSLRTTTLKEPLISEKINLKTDSVWGKGRVAYVNEQKGYGFIKDNETRGTLYFLSGSIPTPVKVNDILTYRVIKGPKGTTADSINIV